MKSKASKFCGGALTLVMAFLGLAGSAFIALIVMLIPVNALADSIAPSSYSTSLKPGASVMVPKTVTISKGTPGTAVVDVFFLADTTGSMGTALAAVQAGAAAIMTNISGLGDVAYGVGEYRDVGDDFVYRLDQDITKNTTLVHTAINTWEADQGGDTPEGQIYALYQVATNVTWRPGSTRIVIWFGDAPGHDPAGPPPQIYETDATAALKAKTIKVMALNILTNPYSTLNDYGQAQRIADATGGKYYPSVNYAQIVTDIQNAIITYFDTYNTVSLGTSSVPAGLTVTVDPPSYTGEYDRSIERTFDFNVTFKAVSPGSYDFFIPVLVNDGTVATEHDNIQVGGLLSFPLRGYTPYTAPVSAVMDNSVLGRTPIEFYAAPPADLIQAFNGEIGDSQYGAIALDPWGQLWWAYMNRTKTAFFPPSGAGVRPLNYLNGAYLSYAGNAGYNYQVPAGTPVLATADGKLYKAATDLVNGAGYDVYNNSYIDHQNGYHSWYLYVSLTPAIQAQTDDPAQGYAQVTRGQVIGHVTASGYEGIADRLHFEVRLEGDGNQDVRDPYKLGLWLPNVGHLEGLLPLLLEDGPPGEY